MFVGYDPIYRPSYGAEARDDYKLYKLSKGLHYTVESDVKVNGKIKNTGGFVGNEIFGKQSKTGNVIGYANIMKALFRFVLLHCDHAHEFKEFVDKSDKVRGVKELINGLKNIAKRMADEEDGSAEEEASSELFVAEGSDKKRSLGEVADKGTTKKRARTE